MVFTRKDGDFHGLLLLVSGRVVFPFFSRVRNFPFFKKKTLQPSPATKSHQSQAIKTSNQPSHCFEAFFCQMFCFGTCWRYQLTLPKGWSNGSFIFLYPPLFHDHISNLGKLGKSIDAKKCRRFKRGLCLFPGGYSSVALGYGPLPVTVESEG